MAQNFLSDIQLGDNIYLRLGNREDGSGNLVGDFTMRHNGTNTFIDNSTGNLYIRNYSDDKNIHFQTDNGSGGITDYIVIHGDENIVKFQEHTRHLDNKEARFGTGSDLKIYHESSTGHSHIKEAGTGELRLSANIFRVLNANTSETMIYAEQDGKVQLRFNESTKFETSDAGVVITGNGYLSSGSFVHFDNGVSNDYAIRKQGTTLEFRTGGTYNFLSGNATFASNITTSGSKISVTQADGDDLATLYQTSADGFLELFTGEATPVSRVKLSSYGDSYIAAASTARVGIGLTNPDEKLHVDGTSRFNGDMHFGTSTGGLIYKPLESSAHAERYFVMFDYTNDASYPFLTNRTPNGAVVIKTGTAAGGGENEHFRIKGGDGTVDAYFTNTNLGIGTSSPDALLDIGVNNIITLDDTGSDTGFVGFGSYNDGSKNRAQGASYYGFGLEIDRPNQLISFNSYASTGVTTSGTDILVLKRDGKVGIGTDSPDTSLHIVKSSSNSQLTLQRTGTATGKYEIYTNTNSLFFYDRAQSALRAMIDSSGNFGIGAANPTVQLDVEDTSNVIIDLNTTTADNNTTIRFQENGTNKATIGYDGTNDGLILTTGGFTAGNGIFIDDSQNVGIGTDDPSQKLEVAGNVKLTGSIMDIRFIESDTTDRNSLIRHQTGLLRFDTISDDEATITTRVALDHSTGYFGINNTSPDTRLHITEPHSTFQFTADTGTAGDGRLNIGHFANGTFIGTYGDDGGAADLIRFGTHSGDERMRIASDGTITFNAYGAGHLKTDANGVISVDTSVVDGSGTANDVVMWSDSNTLTDAPIAISGNDASFAGDVNVNDRIRVGTQTSSDSSIISQNSDIQLRVGSIGYEISPYIRLQGKKDDGDGTYTSVYGDVKLDTVNQKLVFNDPGTNSGTIGQFPMTLDNTGNLEVSGNVIAKHVGGAGLNLRRDDTTISGTNALGYIGFAGDDPTDGTFNYGSLIRGRANGSWASGAYPGELEFQTRNTSGSLTTALTLNKDQSATFEGSITTNLSSEGTYFTGGSGGVRQLSITSGTNISAHALHTFNIASTNGKYEFEINSTPQLTLDSSSATFAGNGEFKNSLKINAPDGGGAPAMTATLNMHGYEGRGVGIKIRDSVNSASGASDREWFVGSGYNSSGFNIGYASDGSQSSYAAQAKLSITTSGNATFAGDISIPVAKQLFFGGGSHTYISEDVDDRLRFFCGGDEHIRFTDGGNGDRTDFYRPSFFAQDVTISGDLIVTGNTTSVNVEDLNVEQGEITLNYNASSDTSGSADGAGIRIQDAVDASNDATISWNATSDEFEFSHPIKVAGVDYKIATFGTDNHHQYRMTGNTDHTLTLTCGSYYQAEIIITAHQTNGGANNNLYIRGIWSNNHTSHHWDEIENIGGLTNSSFTITNGQNGDTTNSGKLEIAHDYVSGSFAGLEVRVKEYFGTHAYAIS